MQSKTDLTLVCEAIAASVSGLTPSIWLMRYGSIKKTAFNGVRPQLRRDYQATYKFYRAYVEDDNRKQRE